MLPMNRAAHRHDHWRRASAHLNAALLALCVCLIVGICAPARAQQVETRRLPPANAISAREFTRIAAVRELRDGRVLIAEAAETSLMVLDFANQITRKIGRAGHGPGEYDVLGSLWPLPKDSTLVADPGNRRWLVLHGTSVVWTLPSDTAAVRVTSSFITGIDSLGYVLTLKRVGRAVEQGRQIVESLAILRVRRITGEVDTVGRLRWRPYVLPSNSTGAARNPMVTQAFGLPLTASEQATLFPDGWIAIARLNPFRVDWRAPDGRWRIGQPLPFRKVPISNNEKSAYVVSIERSTGRKVDPEQIPNWPDHVDPFGEDALLISPDGRLIIARSITARSPQPVYDVVDRDGRLSQVLVLGNGERIIGIGARSVYVVATDRDGVGRLRRHPWP
jgi:hypothetical protein